MHSESLGDYASPDGAAGLEFTKLRFREMTDEYFGITLERAAKILDALGIEIHIKVDMPEREKESEVEPEPVEA